MGAGGKSVLTPQENSGMKKLVALGCVMVACLFAVGCDLDKDKVIGDFCSYYPEVCQYVDFDE